MVLSVILMVFSGQGKLNFLSSSLSVVVLPIQYVVNWPFAVIRKMHDSVARQEALMDENQELRAKQVVLELRLQKLLSVEQENKELRSLLRSTDDVKVDVKVARLLDVNADSNKTEIVIDQGKHADLYLSQPVIDAQGVMGQVIHIGPRSSRVMLINDQRSAIPVENASNGLRSIAEGTGNSGQLQLTNVSKTEKLKVGDIFVTSGLGHIFPQGYPVGEVVQIKRLPGEQFARVMLKPVALLNRSNLVLLLWPKAVPIEEQTA